MQYQGGELSEMAMISYMRIIFNLTMERVKQDPQIVEEQLSAFFNDESLLVKAQKTSLRVAECFSQLKDCYLHHHRCNLNLSFPFLERVALCFDRISYPAYPSPDPICMKPFTRNIRYYVCPESFVNPKEEAWVCEECQGDQFDGLQLKNSDDEGFCDCGDTTRMKKEFICKKHREFREPQPVSEQDRNTCIKEISFIMQIALAMKKSVGDIDNSQNQVLFIQTLKVIQKTIEGSFAYKKVFAQLLMSPFYGQGKADSKPILQVIFEFCWKEIDSLIRLSSIVFYLTQVNGFLKQCYPILWNQIQTISDRWNSNWQMMERNDLNEFIYNPQIILELLEEQKISPLNLYPSQLDEQNKQSLIQQIFEFYQQLPKYQGYPQIARKIVLNSARDSLWSFYLPNFEDNSYMNEKFVDWTISIIKAFQGMQDRRDLFLVLVRQSFAAILMGKKTGLNAETMLALAIISFFDGDLSRLDSIYEKGLRNILGEREMPTSDILAVLQKSLSENFVVSEVQVDDRKHSRRKTALYYVAYKVLSLIYMALSQKSSRDNKTFMTKNIEEKTSKIIGLVDEMEKMYAKVDNQDEITNEQGFQQKQSSLAQAVIGLSKYYCTFLCCSQTKFHEILLSPVIGLNLHDEERRVYRELMLIHKEMKKPKFFNTARHWVRNDDLLKDYMVKQFDQRVKIQEQDEEQQYYTNISPSSDYVHFQACSQMPYRFSRKLATTRSTPLTQFIFRPALFSQMLRPLEVFIKFAGKHPYQDHCYNEQMNSAVSWTISAVVMLYLETKESDFSTFFKSIPKKLYEQNEMLSQEAQELAKLFKQSVGRLKRKESKQEALKKMERLKRARSLKNRKMRQMREKQSDFLKENVKENQQEEEAEQQSEDNGADQEQCIHCKLPGNGDSMMTTLCRVKPSDLLTNNILGESSPFLLITTCGHKIHKHCQIEYRKSINQYNEEEEKQSEAPVIRHFDCFLCKYPSNIRIADVSTLKDSQKELAIDLIARLLKIISEFRQVYPDSAERIASWDNQYLPQLLYTSIVYSIYLYFLSHPGFFIQKQLKAIPLLTRLIEHFPPQRVLPLFLKDKARGNSTLALTMDLTTHLINPKVPLPAIFESRPSMKDSRRSSRDYSEEKQLVKLMYEFKEGQSGLSRQVRSERLGFYQLPADLYDLNRQAGVCYNCQKPHARMRICLVSGIRICELCEKFKNNYCNKYYLGSLNLISSLTGEVSIWRDSYEVTLPSLYSDIFGSVYRQKSDVQVRKGDYFLRTKDWHPMIGRIIGEVHVDQYDQNDDDSSN